MRGHVDLKIRISKGLKVLLDELAETDHYGSGVNDVVRAILQEGVGRHIAQVRQVFQDTEKLREARLSHFQFSSEEGSRSTNPPST